MNIILNIFIKLFLQKKKKKKRKKKPKNPKNPRKYGLKTRGSKLCFGWTFGPSLLPLMSLTAKTEGTWNTLSPLRGELALTIVDTWEPPVSGGWEVAPFHTVSVLPLPSTSHPHFPSTWHNTSLTILVCAGSFHSTRDIKKTSHSLPR